MPTPIHNITCLQVNQDLLYSRLGKNTCFISCNFTPECKEILAEKSLLESFIFFNCFCGNNNVKNIKG